MRERATALLLLAALAAPAAPLGIRLRGDAFAPAERVATPEAGQAIALRFGVPLGELELDAPWSDFRGQTIPPGVYGLRYALQPRLKEHAGADAIRDFALLVPAELAAASGTKRPEEWIAASRLASGTSHPAVMALVPWSGEGAPPAETRIGDYRVEFRSLGDLAIGFVVAGRAAVEEAF